MIAYLGMGLLGSNFVRAMRRQGLDVRVWNRSPEKARVLEADGAKGVRRSGRSRAWRGARPHHPLR